MRFLQMLSKGALGAEREEEMYVCGCPFLCGSDMGFEIFDLHNHTVLIGKSFYTGNPMGA